MTGKLTAFTESAVIGLKLNKKIMHIKDLLKHMEIEINGSKLTKRNYVFVFDSAVVEN